MTKFWPSFSGPKLEPILDAMLYPILEVEISKPNDDTTEEVHEMLKTTKLDAERDASINEIKDLFWEEEKNKYCENILLHIEYLAHL